MFQLWALIPDIWYIGLERKSLTFELHFILVCNMKHTKFPTLLPVLPPLRFWTELNSHYIVQHEGGTTPTDVSPLERGVLLRMKFIVATIEIVDFLHSLAKT